MVVSLCEWPRTNSHKGLPSMPKLLKRQAPVECESPSEICGPVAAAKGRVLSEECGSVKESQGAGARRCASTMPASKQRRGRQVQATQGDHSQNRSLHGLFQDDILIDHLMCRARWNLEHFTPDTKRCESPRSATVLAKRAWDVPHVYDGARAPCGRRRRN